GSLASNSFNNRSDGITFPQVRPYSWLRTVLTGFVAPSPLYPQLKLLSPLSTKAISNIDSALNSCPSVTFEVPLYISPSKLYEKGTSEYWPTSGRRAAFAAA